MTTYEQLMAARNHKLGQIYARLYRVAAPTTDKAGA